VTGGIRSEYVVPKSLADYTVLLIEKAYIKTSAYNGKIQNHVIKYDGRLTEILQSLILKYCV
jgi:hypothetical protein